MALKKDGLIQTYTGSGKNKTTAAFGLTLRAIGSGWNVLMVQFLKGDEETEYGEIKACRMFKDQITVIQSHNTKKIIMEHNKTDKDVKLIQKTWEDMLLELEKGKRVEFQPSYDDSENRPCFEHRPYDMLILDEILGSLNLELIDLEVFFSFIRKIKESRPDLEIVLTGRIYNETLYDKIKDISDLMTDGRCIKHYYYKHCQVCKREYEFRSKYCPNCGKVLVAIDVRQGIEF